MPRQKGTKNRITKDVKEKIESVVFKNIDKLEITLDTLQGKQFIDSYMQLLSYIIPKAKENDFADFPTLEPPKIFLNGVEFKNQN